MFAAYCGLGYMISLMIGWWLVAGFLPPPSPSIGIQAVQTLFQEDYTRIRIGMVIVMWSALIFIPFAAVISYYLARVEGGFGVLSGAALLGGAGNMVLTFYPAVWWLVAAYRPDRAAEITYVFNDLAWLQFIGGVSMYDALPLAIAVAAFCDKSPNPVFPKWVGYFNLLVVVLILPDQLLFFFHSGPFAWSGLFGLWIPLVVFGAWFLVNFAVLRAAILRDRGAMSESRVAVGPGAIRA
jgi:hypothetical protein